MFAVSTGNATSAAEVAWNNRDEDKPAARDWQLAHFFQALPSPLSDITAAAAAAAADNTTLQLRASR